MKKKFSTSWEASKQPRKQRKYRFNAPLHLRKKFVNVNLAKPLREKQKKRNIQIHREDIVKIMKGKYKGKKGKVLEVKLKESRIVVEGIQAKKQDGSKVFIKLQPSNLQIIELSERIKKETNKKEIKPKIKEKKPEQGTKKEIKTKGEKK